MSIIHKCGQSMSVINLTTCTCRTDVRCLTQNDLNLKLTYENGCLMSRNELLERGDCLMCEECGADTCPSHVIYTSAIQAAELRQYEST
jgi:hypothetical protein